MSTKTIRGKAAIIGAGTSPLGKVPGRSPLWLAAEATKQAMADAGLEKGDIDGILCGHSFASPFHRFSIALSEYLGITTTFSNNYQVSGATAATMFNTAAAALECGLAKNILIVGGDSLFSGLTPELAMRSMSESRDQQYEMPFGIPVANTFAMTAHRHMKEYGTTPEQLAKVAVVHRKHAIKTPGAQMTTPITVEDVLNSKMITSPYRKLDCSLISDGGVAFIMTSADRAKDSKSQPLYILGGGECYTHEHIFLAPTIVSTGAIQSSKNAYAMAGVTADDIDFAGVYDCFTGTVIMILEDLGFCGKGEGGPFVEAGEIELGGKIPINTHGGLLSHCHPGIPGSLLHFYEAVKQLRGQAGEQQVIGAELSLVHSLGAGFATQATTIIGTEATL